MGPRPDLSQLSDQEVVALALERQKGAWAELVLRHQQLVRRVIGRHVGTEEHVEQLAQDTFFKAAMFLPNYHPENSFAGWVRAIAYHAAIDYTRSRPLESPSLPHRVSFDVVQIGASYPFDIPTPDPGTPELRGALYDALSRLKPVSRKCFEMRVLGQRTYGEIAEQMHLPVGTVKSHVNRATRKLRALLGHLLDSSDPDINPLKDDGAAGEPAP